MKKLLSLLPFLCACFVSAQVDTFSLRNMPKDYYREFWPDYSMFHHIYNHDDGARCLLYAPSAVTVCVGNQSELGYGFLDVYSHDRWNERYINHFVAGKHADSTIRVVGIAMLYPRYHTPGMLEQVSEWDYGWDKGSRVVDEMIAHGFDILKMQLLDTNMNVIASASTSLADTIGKPVFVFNKERAFEVYMGSEIYSLRYDVFEAFFDTPVSVSDSFYLGAYFENTATDRALALAIPNIMEIHPLPTYYDFPEYNWMARGGFRYESAVVNGILTVVRTPVADSVWFTIDDDGCEVNHGFMLIFPILEVVCDVPQGVSASPMGAGHVLLRWDTGQWDTAWEVSYGPSGTLPGQGTVLATSEPSLMLSGISPDTTYVAYVRSLCTVRDTQWSDWSDSINFGRRQSIGAVAGNVTVDLLPNPAAERLLLTADAELSAIDVYTSAGTHHTRLPATGRAAPIDVSAWPAGTYLLLVHTDRGTLLRRLTVAR